MNKLKMYIKDYTLCILGCLIYVTTYRLFIQPHYLFSGGFLGVSQIVEILTGVPVAQPVTYLLLNIPVIVLGFIFLGKGFMLKTGFIVGFESLLYTLVPTFDAVLTDKFASCVIGGCGCGLATALMFNALASSGGTDIIAMIIASRKPNIKVGMIGVMFNVLVYSTCAILFSLETALYSIIFSVFTSLIIDKLHSRNRICNAFIFCDKWRDVDDYIVGRLGRSATAWMGAGAYSDNLKHIVFTVLSDYEFKQLKNDLPDIDDSAFVVVNRDSSVLGNFVKKIA